MDTSFWQGRRVAVTGATGFVGFHVARALVERRAQVTALVRSTSDILRLVSMGVICRTVSFDDPHGLLGACTGSEMLFHVAGAVAFHDDWEMFRRINVEGTRNVLEAARQAGVRRVVHTSSIAAVGAARQPRLLDEESAWNLGPFQVPYVTTKREAEEVALTCKGGPMEVVVVNPASVVGPDDHAGSEFGILCKRFWRGRIPVHFGGGNNIVDVRDVALGHLLAAQKGRAGQRYILGGENRTYTSFFGELARASGRAVPRIRLPSVAAGIVAAIEQRCRKARSDRPYLPPAQARLLPLFFYYSCEKARRELGYVARPLRISLTDTHRFWMGDRRPLRAA